MLGRRSDHGKPHAGTDNAVEQNEARLISQIAAGELNAFEDLYRIYHPRLSRFLDRVSDSPHRGRPAHNVILRRSRRISTF